MFQLSPGSHNGIFPLNLSEWESAGLKASHRRCEQTAPFPPAPPAGAVVVVVVVLSSPTGAPAGGEEETGLGPNPGEPPSPFLTKLGQSPAPLWDTGVCSSALAVSSPPGLLPQACSCRSAYIKTRFPYVDLASSIKPIHAGLSGDCGGEGRALKRRLLPQRGQGPGTCPRSRPGAGGLTHAAWGRPAGPDPASTTTK